MADADAIRTALESVTYPVLDRTLGELGLIRDVGTGRLGSATVSIALPVIGHPSDEALQAAITEACQDVRGVRSVQVDVTELDEAEQVELMDRLTDEAPAVNGPGSRTRVISVSSGKGGVGKSSVTTNLAVALARTGHRVGVMDADVWGFSIPRMLGTPPAPVLIGRSIIPPAAHGVKVMSMDYFVGDEKAVIWRGPMLHKAMQQFIEDVFWDGPDFLLVDTPPGTGDVAISLSQFLPRAQMLLVTTPQPTAQRVARRAGLMAAEVDQELMGVVENMSWFTGDDGKRYELFGAGGGADLAEQLDVPLLGQVPLLTAVREGADVGIPAVVAAPGSEVEQAFDAIALEVVARKPRVRTHPDLVIR
ncbi:MAG: Mrp/NBP35 family ATP-binding protein [Acidimicrobiia bacterium]